MHQCSELSVAAQIWSMIGNWPPNIRPQMVHLFVSQLCVFFYLLFYLGILINHTDFTPKQWNNVLAGLQMFGTGSIQVQQYLAQLEYQVSYQLDNLMRQDAQNISLLHFEHTLYCLRFN